MASITKKKHTQGDLRLIRSKKHPGAVFIKIAKTKDCFIAKIYSRYRSTDEHIENVNHFVNAWKYYEAVIQLLRELDGPCNIAISATPTGDYRNRLTELNILRLEAIDKAERKVTDHNENLLANK